MFPFRLLNSKYDCSKYIAFKSYCDQRNEPPKPKVTDMPSMSEPVPGLPTPIFSTFKEQDQTTEVTVLKNGLTVASESRFGEFCTVGGKP